MSADLLQDFLSNHEAKFGKLSGKKVVQNYGDLVAEHRYLTQKVALIDLTSRGAMAALGVDLVKNIN